MEWHWTPAAIGLLSTSALSLMISMVFFTRRAIPGMSAMACAMLAASGWTLVAALEAAAVSEGMKILFSKLEYAGSGSLVVSFLLFAAKYTGRASWITRWRVTGLWLLPMAAVALTATNALHHAVWIAFETGPAGSNSLIYHHGIGFFVILVYLYAYVLVASYWLVSAAVRASAVQKRQSTAILLATAFPWLAGILYAGGVTLLPGLNLVPISFVVSGAILAVGIMPLRLFELVPVARNQLIEGMGDAIVVTDASRRVVDANPSARRLLSLPADVIGADAAQVLPFWSEVAPGLHADKESRLGLLLSEEPPMHVDLRVAPLSGGARKSQGLLIVLRDTTARHLAERSLQEANQRLQGQVQEIERLQTELREQAIRDSLTGLYNRRYLDDMMPRILDRARADEVPVSVIMFDIDDFKRVNDEHGHAVGDALLAELGGLFLARTRPGDIACRYGGEEFVLVLPRASLSHALRRAEDFRRAFSEIRIHTADPDQTPTLSIGVAVYPKHGQTQDDLLRAADRALYCVKDAGKNSISYPGETS